MNELESKIKEIVDKYATFKQIDIGTGVAMSSVWCYDRKLIAELKDLFTQEQGKNWYYEGDELVITKGKWVINRYPKDLFTQDTHPMRGTVSPPLTKDTKAIKEEAIEDMKNIEGFMGFSVDGGGVWYALFDIESKFWEFLNRIARSKSMERPLSPVGRYSYRKTTKIHELVGWLLKEHRTYLSKSEREGKDE